MSRVANNPVVLPKGVEANFSGQTLTVKGGKGSLELQVHELVAVTEEDGQLKVGARREHPQSNALAGTTRALVDNMVKVLSWYDNEAGYSNRMVDLAAMIGSQL